MGVLGMNKQHFFQQKFDLKNAVSGSALKPMQITTLLIVSGTDPPTFQKCAQCYTGTVKWWSQFRNTCYRSVFF
jgi:hypothetical protein